MALASLGNALPSLENTLQAYFNEIANFAYSYKEYRPSTIQKAQEIWGDEGVVEYKTALLFFSNWESVRQYSGRSGNHPPDLYFRGHNDARVQTIMTNIVQAMHLWITLYGEHFSEYDPDGESGIIRPRFVTNEEWLPIAMRE